MVYTPQSLFCRVSSKATLASSYGIDSRDGIVKMDLNLDIKIVDMPSLAVYVPALLS